MIELIIPCDSTMVFSAKHFSCGIVIGRPHDKELGPES